MMMTPYKHLQPVAAGVNLNLNQRSLKFSFSFYLFHEVKYIIKKMYRYIQSKKLRTEVLEVDRSTTFVL